MKRKGVDIYGYPIYEEKERPFVVRLKSLEPIAVVSGRNLKDAMGRFDRLLREALEHGIFFEELH